MIINKETRATFQSKIELTDMVSPNITKKKVLTIKEVSKVSTCNPSYMDFAFSTCKKFASLPLKNNSMLAIINPKIRMIISEERCIFLPKAYNKSSTEINKNNFV
jgi:hypothetical protein